MHKDRPLIYIPLFDAALVGTAFILLLFNPWGDLPDSPVPPAWDSPAVWGFCIFVVLWLWFWRGRTDVHGLLHGRRTIAKIVAEGFLIWTAIPVIFEIYVHVLREPLVRLAGQASAEVRYGPVSVGPGTPADFLSLALLFGLAGAAIGILVGTFNRVCLRKYISRRNDSLSL